MFVALSRLIGILLQLENPRTGNEDRTNVACLTGRAISEPQLFPLHHFARVSSTMRAKMLLYHRKARNMSQPLDSLCLLSNLVVQVLSKKLVEANQQL